MLLAMILLQLHGVKFPGGFPDPDQEHNNKKKRQRTSPDQLAILEQIFQTDKMPSQQTRVQLADQLGMSSRRVQIWFQNKRAKVKRGLGKSSDVCVLFLVFSFIYPYISTMNVFFSHTFFSKLTRNLFLLRFLVLFIDFYCYHFLTLPLAGIPTSFLPIVGS